jgi:hypothetical protein
MPPLQPLVDEDLTDAAPLDRDALRLVEVVAQAVRRPAAKGEVQPPRVGQRRGDHFGALLGGVRVRPAGAGPILQAVEAPLIEAMDPGVDRGARDAQLLGDLAGPMSVGEGQEDPGALHESGLCGPRVSPPLEGGSLLGGELAERDSGCIHGCTSLATKGTPFLRPTTGVSSLAGCTT